jgi:integrase
MGDVFKSVTIVYRTADGRRCKRGEPSATPARVESRNWYGRYKDGDGRTRTVALCRDKGKSREMLDKLRTDGAMARVGLVNPHAEQEARTLAEHVEDYRRALLAKGDTGRHADQQADRIGRVVEGCRFKRIGDITADRVAEFLAGLRSKGMATETSNHYLRAFKAFSTWLMKVGRTDRDPTRFLATMNPEADRRRRRRALSSDDFARLVRAAQASRRVICGLTGQDRAMHYLTAAYTGWRASELASLTPASLDLEAATATVQAAYSKRRRPDEAPLHSELVRQLKVWAKGRPAGAPLWPGKWAANRHGAEMVRVDLAAAELPYQDAAGRVYDFHALRGQFVTALARAGVQLVRAQKLARHSTPNLTANAYTHLALADMREDVERLAAPPEVISGAGKPPRRGGRKG